VDSHWGPGGKKVYTIPDCFEANGCEAVAKCAERGFGQSLGRLGVLDRVVNALAGMRRALRESPTVIIVAKANGRDVMHVTGV
jgi:hypothetical protein